MTEPPSDLTPVPPLHPPVPPVQPPVRPLDPHVAPAGSPPPIPVLPVSTTGGLRHLARPVLVLWLFSAAIWAVFVTVLATAVELGFLRKATWWPMPFGVGIVISLIVLVSPVVLFTLLGYRRWGYEIRGHDVVVESGVLWRVRRSLPRSKVQHVDIRSGPVSRALGLVEVHLHAAGSLGPVATIPGLTPEAAEELRQALVEEAGDGV